MATTSKRLDKYLVQHGFAESRTLAQKLIKEGAVTVNGTLQTKSSCTISSLDTVKVHPSLYIRYVSQGGIKLQHALDIFSLNFNHLRILDVGASTGGFTDCALQHGAQYVYAVDVGHAQLHERLVHSPQVRNLSPRDIRTLSLYDIDNEQVDAVLCDVSFISLTHVLPSITPLWKQNGIAIFLIKPQFEVGPQGVTKAGVVRNNALIQSTLEQIVHTMLQQGITPQGIVESPLQASNRNREFLLYAHHMPYRYTKDVHLLTQQLLEAQ